MSDKPLYTSTATLDPTSSIAQANKVLSNTYWLLGLTLAFSALSATISVAVGVPPMAGLVLMLVGFGLLFVVHKMADSAKGLPAIFAFTGVMGASIGPTLSFYLALENGPTIVLQALAGTAMDFFSLSAYALTSKIDFSYLGGFLMTGLVIAVVAMIANIFLNIPALSLTLSAVVVMIMAGLILFDTSRIISGGETNYIRATVGLYLSIFNLFMHLLHLIAVFTGGDDLALLIHWITPASSGFFIYKPWKFPSSFVHRVPFPISASGFKILFSPLWIKDTRSSSAFFTVRGCPQH